MEKEKKKSGRTKRSEMVILPPDIKKELSTPTEKEKRLKQQRIEASRRFNQKKLKEGYGFFNIFISPDRRAELNLIKSALQIKTDKDLLDYFIYTFNNNNSPETKESVLNIRDKYEKLKKIVEEIR
jgi:hypothetical protein